jgi:hypothetical protein
MTEPAQPTTFNGHLDQANRLLAAGWAANIAAPDDAVLVQIFVNGTLAAEVSAERPRSDLATSGKYGHGRHGFMHHFAPPLAADLDHTIEARFSATGRTLPNGLREIASEAPPPLHRADSGKLAPVLVTAPGRSGTTLLMSCLAASPAIIAAELVPYELRLLSYYAAAYHVLTAPANFEKSTHPDHLEGDGYHVGFNPFTNPQYAGAFKAQGPLLDYRENFVPARIRAAFRDIVEEHYLRLAADKRKTGVQYFAEKGNSLHKPTRDFVRASFPGLREIVIVRDPRDVLCSHMSYFASEAEKAFSQLSHSSHILTTIAAEKRGDICVIRYEDMLTGSPRCFDALSAFLDADVRLPAADKGEAIFARHATSKTPSDSVGRWRHQLPPGFAARCREDWRKFLENFGYALD